MPQDLGRFATRIMVQPAAKQEVIQGMRLAVRVRSTSQSAFLLCCSLLGAGVGMP